MAARSDAERYMNGSSRAFQRRICGRLAKATHTAAQATASTSPTAWRRTIENKMPTTAIANRYRRPWGSR